MFGQNRDELRRFFVTSWQKHQARQPLQPLERLVAQIVESHPEYHAQIQRDGQLDRDFSPQQGETNPWLHMGMHVTLGEQLGADRPSGIRAIHRQLASRLGDSHSAEHAMMDCLGLILWEAQREARAPDEAAYLACLQKLGKD